MSTHNLTCAACYMHVWRTTMLTKSALTLLSCGLGVRGLAATTTVVSSRLPVAVRPTAGTRPVVWTIAGDHMRVLPVYCKDVGCAR